jgi:hypothetical protein
MKLAKYMLPAGQPGVGRIDGDDLLPLDLTKGQYRSLFEILESDNPNETAEFLTPRRPAHTAQPSHAVAAD